MSEERRVEIESTRRLLDDSFKVDEARVSFERFDGRMSPPVRRLCFERGESAAVLLHDPARACVVLVEQFRYPTHTKGRGWLTEVIAGVIEEGDDAEATARREAREEAGYELEEVEVIARFFPSPGGSSERVHLFAAEVRGDHRVGSGGGVVSEGEDLRVVEWSEGEVQRRVADGHVEDAKTLVALLWWLRRATAV